MQPISKSEVDYLIQNNILKLNKQGNYGDNLVVTGSKHHGRKPHNDHNSQHKSRQKQRYTTDYTYNKLLESQKEDYKKMISDINNVKENQRYMFSDNVS